ncbi:hypothetical protein RhiirA5_434435 [Rhizophagus irregularis]|uniref:Uncharacterized protein n=1 Tax=Rhizophagus irregularis TaxID=588596 RepID=A0A2N0NQ30_9GLOM|nr:hypothetical protein RhiirA5_434435 [Rhizophagus irregularis]
MLITTNKALAFYTETSNYGNNPPRYNLSPSSSNLEVSCNIRNCHDGSWEISNSKLENHQVRFLRSRDIQFTIENDTFQEVIYHNETVGER